MKQRYVCEEYETPHEEGYRMICPIEEHDKKIREDAVNNFVVNAITEFQKFELEHGYPTLGDISVVLSDVAEQLKEQKQ